MKGIGPVVPAGRTVAVNLLMPLMCLAFGLALPARADSDPNACRGIDFDAKRPLVASRISARPHVNFIKGSDDDAKCPTDKEACRKKTHLVPGDVVLTGRVQGAFTCVSYQSFHTRKQNWTTGWLPTASLAPVETMSSPKAADWIGSWSHPGGTISIARGDGGKLSIEGEQTYRAAQSVHSGVLGATVVPMQGMIAFAEDGSVPFDNAVKGSALCGCSASGCGCWWKTTSSAAAPWSRSQASTAASKSKHRRDFAIFGQSVVYAGQLGTSFLISSQAFPNSVPIGLHAARRR